MEAKAILLISENEKAFTVNALKSAFEAKSILTYSVGAVSPQVNEYLDSNMISLVFIQGGENWKIFQNILLNLRGKCHEKKVPIVINGTHEEVESIKRAIPESMITEVFPRATEVAVIAEKVEAILSGLENKELIKKILIVDDSGIMLRTLLENLEDKYDVRLANSAANAFKSIEKEHPDLILLDYEMPICSGAQFFEMIRGEEDTKDIPVIFLTSKDDAEIVRSVLKLKPEGYILKNVPLKKIVEMVDDFFAKRK